MKRLLTLPFVVLCVFLYVRCSEGASPAQGHVELGGIYYDAGEYDEAIAEYKKAIAIDPNYAGNPRYSHKLGDTYREQGKYDLAVESYQKAIAIDPEDAFFHYELARVYSLQDKKALSIESPRKAISLDRFGGKYYIRDIRKAEKESDFDNIRESPEFQALIRSVK